VYCSWLVQCAGRLPPRAKAGPARAMIVASTALTLRGEFEWYLRWTQSSRPPWSSSVGLRANPSPPNRAAVRPRVTPVPSRQPAAGAVAGRVLPPVLNEVSRVIGENAAAPPPRSNGLRDISSKQDLTSPSILQGPECCPARVTGGTEVAVRNDGSPCHLPLSNRACGCKDCWAAHGKTVSLSRAGWRCALSRFPLVVLKQSPSRSWQTRLPKAIGATDSGTPVLVPSGTFL
jgi:hypothetical protein